MAPRWLAWRRWTTRSSRCPPTSCTRAPATTGARTLTEQAAALRAALSRTWEPATAGARASTEHHQRSAARATWRSRTWTDRRGAEGAEPRKQDRALRAALLHGWGPASSCARPSTFPSGTSGHCMLGRVFRAAFARRLSSAGRRLRRCMQHCVAAGHCQRLSTPRLAAVQTCCFTLLRLPWCHCLIAVRAPFFCQRSPERCPFNNCKYTKLSYPVSAKHSAQHQSQAAINSHRLLMRLCYVMSQR